MSMQRMYKSSVLPGIEKALQQYVVADGFCFLQNHFLVFIAQK
jgi:hypothetical protein